MENDQVSKTAIDKLRFTLPFVGLLRDGDVQIMCTQKRDAKVGELEAFV